MTAGIKLDKDEFIKKARAIHGDTFDYSRVVYINNNTKVEIGRQDDTWFWQIPKNHLKGCVDKKSSILNMKKTNLERYGTEAPLQNKEIMEKLKTTNLERYGVESTLQHEETKEKIKKSNLKKCGVENPLSNEEIKEKIKNTNLEKYGVENPLSNKIIREKAAQTNLEKYGDTAPGRAFREQITETNINRYGSVNPLMNTEVKEKADTTRQKKFIEKYEGSYNILISNIRLPDDTYAAVYPNACQIISFVCNKCNSQQEANYETFTYRAEYYNTPCHACANLGLSHTSGEQIQLENFIKDELGLSILTNVSTIIPPKHLDIVLEDQKIAIEYNGLNYHKESENISEKYHYNKMIAAQKVGYRLITIFSDEWLSRNKVVKNRLRNILLPSMNNIYARNTIVKPLNVAEVTEFINNNHTMGYHGSRYRYGLFHKDQLLSVMTFSLPTPTKGGKMDDIYSIELDRYCSASHVIGGPSKLLSAFCKDHPEYYTIYSFADRRWSDGDLYYKMGFTLEHETPVNFWYIRGNRRYHRSKSWSEDVSNYDRIWDCGSLKFTYQNPHYRNLNSN